MATYTYTANLTDFGENPFPDANPRVTVTADRDTFGPGGLLARREILVPVGAGGALSMTLVASVDTSPTTGYTIKCEWLDANGVPRGWAEWKFTAVVGGGSIPGMVNAPLSVWFVGPPWPPAGTPGFYFDTITNDVGRI